MPTGRPQPADWRRALGLRLACDLRWAGQLDEAAVDEATCWQRVTVPAWYRERERVVEICSATAIWRHAGLPVLPIRWVLLRDPQSYALCLAA
jgi:hypothetical protein